MGNMAGQRMLFCHVHSCHVHSPDLFPKFIPLMSFFYWTGLTVEHHKMIFQPAIIHMFLA
jgi:hypothetical protein